MSAVVVTVRCGLCKAERAPRPGKLGEVRRWPSGLVRWGVEDWRGDRQMGGREQKLVAYNVLEDPRRSTYTPPEFLPTLCERHGHGRVPTRDVIGKRGTVYLTPMSATA